MKKLIKILMCLIMGIMMGTMTIAATACGGPENAEDLVKFFLWDSGWGTDGYDAIVKAFNEKALAENYGFQVEFEFSSDQTAIGWEFSSGTSDYDVFINPIRGSDAYVYLEPLDDILDQAYGNETKTLRQKFPAKFLDMVEFDGSIGMLPNVSQVSAIVYNKQIFADGGFEVPKTTDELTDLVLDSEFNTTEHKAWIHFQDGANGYYPYIMDVWTAQYMGYDNYYALENLTDYTDYKGNTISGEKNLLLAEDGRRAMLDVLDDVLGHETVHHSSNAQNFTTAQTAFLNGQAVMMVNGNWLGQEMMKNGGAFDGEKFGMMKAPVISSIIENLPEDSIKNDKQLRAVIDEVDAGKTFAEATLNFECKEADYNRVAEARGMVVSGGCASGMYIANYSNVKDKAKKFVQFFYSDEANIIWSGLKRNELVTGFSDESIREQAGYYDNWSSWDKQVDELFKTTNYPIGNYRTRSPFYVLNGQSIYINVDCISTLTATNKADIMSADDLWAEMQNKINKNWHLWGVALEN